MPHAFLLLALVLPLVKGVESHTGIFRTERGNVPERFADASVTWTDDALVVRFRRETVPGRKMRVEGSAADPARIFYGGDGSAVELLVSPHPDRPETFYQFGVNPSNVLYQAKGQDASWRPAKPVVSRVRIEPDCWHAEFRIPFGAFGEKPVAPGAEWRADFGCGGSDWAGVRTRHDPSVYGILRFGTKPQTGYLERITCDDEGVYHVTYAVRKGGGVVEIPHKALSANRLEIRLDGDRLEEIPLAEDGGDAEYLALDRYYYPTHPAIAYSAKLFRPDSRVTIRQIATDEVVFSADSTGRGRLADLALKPGEYAFEIADPVRRTSCQFEIVGDARAANANVRTVRLSADRPEILTLDDGTGACVPFYPVCWSEGRRDTLPFVPVFRTRYVTKPVAGHLFDATKPLYGAESGLASQRDGTALCRLSYEAHHGVVVNRGKDAPPQVMPDAGAFYREAYRALKVRFPGKVFTIHTDQARDLADYSPACDVFEYADFECSYGASPLPELNRCLTRLKASVKEKPVLYWLGGSLPDGGRRKSADEMNTAVRYCILRGVAGNVLHLGHGGVSRDRTRLYSPPDRPADGIRQRRSQSQTKKGMKSNETVHDRRPCGRCFRRLRHGAPGVRRAEGRLGGTEGRRLR